MITSGSAYPALSAWPVADYGARILFALSAAHILIVQVILDHPVADRWVPVEGRTFIAMELDATSLYVLRRHEGLPEIYGEAPTANRAARDYFDRMIEAAATRTGAAGGPPT